MSAGIGTARYATRRFVLIVGAITFLSVCGAIVAYQEWRDSQEVKALRGGCGRTNVLRGAVDDFLKAARDARQAEGNYETAQSYQDIINRIEGVEHTYEESAEVNCEAAYP